MSRSYPLNRQGAVAVASSFIQVDKLSGIIAQLIPIPISVIPIHGGVKLRIYALRVGNDPLYIDENTKQYFATINNKSAKAMNPRFDSGTKKYFCRRIKVVSVHFFSHSLSRDGVSMVGRQA